MKHQHYTEKTHLKHVFLTASRCPRQHPLNFSLQFQARSREPPLHLERTGNT